MELRNLGARPWGRALLVIGVWTFVAAFFAAQNVASDVIRGEPVRWQRTIVIEFLWWIPWIVLTPVLLHVVRRWRFESERWGRALVVHLAVAGAFSLVQSAWFLAMLLPALRRMGELETARAVGGEFWRRTAVGSLTAYYKYWLFLGVYYAFDYYRKYREREVRASRLEARLASAQLEALRMQLHPHFLFNTLHSVSMLNLTDVDAANRVLVKLSNLLRMTLDRSDAQEVPLEDEIVFLDRYLEIEAIRFADRLEIEWDIEEEAGDALVPNLVLQPLVENAIRHGVSPSSAAGRIAVRARVVSDDLVMEVEDDGPGPPADWDPGRDVGVGISNVRDRLDRLYGERGRLEFERPDAGGCIARVVVPLRRAGVAGQVA